MKNSLIPLLFRPMGMVAIGLFICFSACEKSPFDPTRKWTGEWTMDMIVYDYTSQQTHRMERTVTVEAVESPNPEQRWGLNIAGYTVGVDRAGTLYSPDYHRNPMKEVGEISKSELSLDMNTSTSTAGTQINFVGTR